MRYAVEARIFNNGKTVYKIRTAEIGEENGCRETKTCDIWIDVFNTEKEAIDFAKGYKNA